MDKDRGKILETAKKIKALAERGIGGEMGNAKVMLAEYMKKHNISESELEDFKGTVNYATLTDEQFMAEIIKDGFRLVLKYILSRYSENEEHKAEARKSFGDFAKNILNAMAERSEKLKNKHK